VSHDSLPHSRRICDAMSEVSKAETVIAWIEEAVELYGDSVAATGVGETLTLRQLWSRATELAQQLLSRGVVTETRIGLWAEQSSDLLIGIVGIMAAGAAFVPLDPSFPEDRLRYIAENAELPFIVAPDRHLPRASKMGIPVISTSTFAEFSRAPAALPNVVGNNAAYVFYTSGSTGRPKGVVIEHTAILEFLRWLLSAFDLPPGYAIMTTSSPSFDASLPNEILPLVTGGTFVSLPNEARTDPYALSNLLAQHRPRVLQTSPTMLRMLSETGWTGDADLDIWTGGERTPAFAIAHITPRVRSLSGFYGPTEATVAVTVARLSEHDLDAPIGRPLGRNGCILLDPDGSPTAEGETGEIFITGTQLARGYLNNPEQSSERFVIIDVGDGVRERAYRTGDLARVKPDGNLLLTGRVDNQIKLRGYRIELGEIELRLTEFPRVLEAVVIAHRAHATDEPRLIAFIKCDDDVLTEELRGFARETLPDYMVPSGFIRVDDFPIAPTGKIDKSQLTNLVPSHGAPVLGDTPVSAKTMSSTDLELSVAELFASALDIGTESIGVDDDFFDLGGTSLRCVRLFMSIEERFRISIPLSTLVTASSVRLLSDVIRAEDMTGGPAEASADWTPDTWEWVLGILWSEILQVPNVKSTDNFFDLGGGPDEAKRMFEDLKVSNGVDVTYAELQHAPTVSEFASLTVRRTNSSCLVPLQTKGSKTPFFCIAGPGGLALTFLPLSRVLGSDQPFYGLQSHGLEKRALPDFTLASAAARYERAIRRVQPHGPYLIGGHSYGGALALKVAHRLQDAGESVALLVLFDCILPDGLTGLKDPPASSLTGRVRALRRRYKRTSRLGIILRLPFVGIVRETGIAKYESFILHGAIQVRHAKRIPPWSGRTLLYLSEGEHASRTEAGWKNLLTGQWECVAVKGDHAGLIQRPHVQRLSSHLTEHFASALATISDTGGRSSTVPRQGGKSSTTLN